MLPRRVATAGTRPRARSGTRALPRAVTVARLPVLRVARAQSEPLARPVVLAARVVRAVLAVLVVWVVRVVRLPTRRRARSVRRRVAVPHRPAGRARLPVDQTARELARRPRWAAISGRVTRPVARPPLRAALAALARVAAPVLPAARAVPVRAELVGLRPAARVVSPTVGRAVRSRRVLVVTPARRLPAQPPAVLAPRVRVATVATPMVASRSPRLSP